MPSLWNYLVYLSGYLVYKLLSRGLPLNEDPVRTRNKVVSGVLAGSFVCVKDNNLYIDLQYPVCLFCNIDPGRIIAENDLAYTVHYGYFMNHYKYRKQSFNLQVGTSAFGQERTFTQLDPQITLLHIPRYD